MDSKSRSSLFFSFSSGEGESPPIDSSYFLLFGVIALFVRAYLERYLLTLAQLYYSGGSCFWLVHLREQLLSLLMQPFVTLQTAPPPEHFPVDTIKEGRSLEIFRD